jgi:hypothetical protein
MRSYMHIDQQPHVQELSESTDWRGFSPILRTVASLVSIRRRMSADQECVPHVLLIALRVRVVFVCHRAGCHWRVTERQSGDSSEAELRLSVSRQQRAEKDTGVDARKQKEQRQMSTYTRLSSTVICHSWAPRSVPSSLPAAGLRPPGRRHRH